MIVINQNNVVVASADLIEVFGNGFKVYDVAGPWYIGDSDANLYTLIDGILAPTPYGGEWLWTGSDFTKIIAATA